MHEQRGEVAHGELGPGGVRRAHSTLAVQTRLLGGQSVQAGLQQRVPEVARRRLEEAASDQASHSAQLSAALDHRQSARRVVLLHRGQPQVLLAWLPHRLLRQQVRRAERRVQAIRKHIFCIFIQRMEFYCHSSLKFT